MSVDRDILIYAFKLIKTDNSCALLPLVALLSYIF